MFSLHRTTGAQRFKSLTLRRAKTSPGGFFTLSSNRQTRAHAAHRTEPCRLIAVWLASQHGSRAVT